MRGISVDLITAPTCRKDDSRVRPRCRLYGRGRFGGGITYVGKKRKGDNDPPHPMPRATTGPNSADTNHEVWVLGSIQVRLARLWSEPLIATQLQGKIRTLRQCRTSQHAVTPRSPLGPEDRSAMDTPSEQYNDRGHSARMCCNQKCTDWMWMRRFTPIPMPPCTPLRGPNRSAILHPQDET